MSALSDKKVFDNALGTRIKGNIYHHEGPSGSFKKQSYFQDDTKTAFAAGQKNNWYKWGSKDRYPNFLRDLYRKSSIHNSAVNLKARMIQGGKLQFKPLETYYRKNQDGTYEKVEGPKSEAEKQRVVEEAEMFALQIGAWEYYKAAAMEMTWAGGYVSMRQRMRDFKGDLKLQGIYVQSFLNARLGVKRKLMGNSHKSTEIYLSSDFESVERSTSCHFSQYTGALDEYSKIKYDEFPTIGTTARYFGRFTPYRKNYPTPDYESKDVLRYVDLDDAISVDDYNSFINGLSLKYIVVRYRPRMDKEEDEELAREDDKELFRKNGVGPEGKKHLYLWSDYNYLDNGDVGTPKQIEIIPIPHNNTADIHKILREERLMKILNGHCIVVPELIGLSPTVGRGLQSQSDHIVMAQQQLYWNSIKPSQKIIDDDLTETYIDNGHPVEVSVTKSTANFRMMTYREMQLALSIDEIRALYEFGKASEEDLEQILARTAKNDQNGL